MRSQLFIFPEAVKRSGDVERWFATRPLELGEIARQWFDVFRGCGEDVRELLHDHHPTACVGEAAFGYVNVFTSHVNVGFFRGAELDDPGGLLQGSGKMMRHVKLRPEQSVNDAGLRELIAAAYSDMKKRFAGKLQDE